MSSTQSQTPVQIKPAGVGNNPTNLLGPSQAPPSQQQTKSNGNIRCPPGQIKDSSGNCVSPSSAIQSLTKPQAPATPAVNLAAPAPTVATVPQAQSPRSNFKTPKFNTHVQQQQQGGANPPTLTPPPVGGGPTPDVTGTPPTTPTIPPASIPPPTPQPKTPLPPAQVPPRQQPPTPPIPHPHEDRPIPRAERPPGDFDRRFPIRTWQRFPDRFHDFDHRFDDDRRRFDCDDFREEFDDDDDRRFRIVVERFTGIDTRLVLHILGIAYDPIEAALGRDIPTGSGIWVIGVDGQWYRVTRAENNLINQIESTRMVDLHDPIIIGGGPLLLQSGNRATGGINPAAIATIGVGLLIIWWLTGGKKK